MNVTLFAPKKYKKYANNIIAKQYVRKDVGITTVDNGVIAVDEMISPETHITVYGVFDANGGFVKESFQYHKHKAQYKPQKPSGDIPYIDSTVILLGNVHDAFGHFLLKHLNRAWILTYNAYRDAKVVLINDKCINPIPKFVTEFIKLLGAELIIVDKTTQFKRVYVPSQTFNFYTYWAPEFAIPFEYMAEKQTGYEYDKIYMSRAKMKQRAPFGERRMEQLFRKNGFHIVYPETLPLGEQIALMKNCRVLAGCGGTALHMALFMPRGGTVIQLKRNTELKDNIALQYMVCAVKNINLVGVWASMEKIKTNWSDGLPQIIGLTKYLKACFDYMGYKYDAADAVLDIAELQEYDQQIKSAGKGRTKSKIKRRFIHFTAAFIPFRKLRVRYCEKMKRAL